MNSNRLVVLSLSDSKRWNDIVSSFKDADTYYFSGYVESLMNHGDGEPILFYYDWNGTRAINVVMKRKIVLGQKFKKNKIKKTFFDFSTPYGYGGWIIEGTDSKNVFKTYKSWCKKNNIISEFVRFHPVTKNYETSLGFYNVVKLGKTVTIDLSNKEQIWNNFTNKNRNVIRKAENNNIVINNGYSKELLDSFIEIYNQTMTRDSASSYYYFDKQYYEILFDRLDKDARIFYAKMDKKIIAASIIIKCNDKLTYHLSGSLKEYGNLAATNLLLWKAACWGNEHGCKTFHLGGGVGSADDGLFHFKKAFFKGELTQFCIGKKVFLKRMYNKLAKLRIEIENKNFFPIYRG